ncbi:MAG: hypothetical protein ABEJ36_03115 [Candidatus Nanosalina sp.]
MTFYSFLSADLRERENRARYIRADIDWFLGTMKDADVDTGGWRTILSGVPEKIRDNEELSKDQRQVVGAMIYGDSRYFGGNEEWLDNRFFEMLIDLGERMEEDELESLASEYVDLENLDEPGYSSPGDVRNAEKAIQNVSSVDRAVIASLVTTLDWMEYVCQEISVDYRNEFFDEKRREAVGLFGEPGEVGDFLGTVLRQNTEWLEELEEDFGFSAPLPELMCRRMETIRRENLG